MHKKMGKPFLGRKSSTIKNVVARYLLTKNQTVFTDDASIPCISKMQS